MNTLIIIANPNKHSFAHVIAQEYTQDLDSVHIIDLYDPHYRQEFLQLNEISRPLLDAKTELHQGWIQRAEEIVFCFPLWWFDCPAILKNRFDVNFTSGFAYRYRSRKFFPDKLLHDKQIRVFCTTGGPSRFYKSIGWILIVLPWFIGRIYYVGLHLKSWTWFCDMNTYKTLHSREWMRKTVRDIARQSR